MIVYRRSPVSGLTNMLDLPLTETELRAIEHRTQPIQQVAPQLTPDQREFLMTGLTSADWSAIFSSEETV